MNIPYLKITGWGDAIRALYMSNKNYTPELEEKISACESDYQKFLEHRDRGINDHLAAKFSKEAYDYIGNVRWFEKEISKVIKYGKRHITLLRFVDVSWVVSGLHRGAQDDFDAHAERYDNRIVRMSTRTVNDSKIAEVSDWYKDKILTWQDLEKIFELPEEVKKDGAEYIRTSFGYIRKDYVGTNEERDVRRGLVPLATASTFIVKCQITELCHVFRERNEKSPAAPELRKMMEELIEMINDQVPYLTRDFFLTSCLQ